MKAATAPAPAPATPPPTPKPDERARLRVTTYDRAASLLVALLILVGATVVAMFIIWLTSRISVPNVAVPVEMENVGGREDGVLGESLEMDAPNETTLSEQTDLAEPELQETVAMVNDALAQVVADLSDPLLNAELEAGSQGKSTGTGNAPPLGSGDGDQGGFPRAERWRIQFDNTTLQAYAQQLDEFGIELAAIGGGRVEYAASVSTANPTTRVAGTGATEDRLYMSWQGGTLRQFDTQLLRKAKIDPTGRIIVQFYPPEVENRLAGLEKAFANREPQRIRRTTFGIRATGGKRDFYVISQDAL